jgi:hypothetical protein
MPRNTSPSPLADRLDNRMAELEATDIEVGALIDRDPEEVAAWRRGKAVIDDEARVLLRSFLADDPHAAARALERIRTRQTRDLRSEDWQTADVAIPYGAGFAGTDAERPK